MERTCQLLTARSCPLAYNLTKSVHQLQEFSGYTCFVICV